VKHSDDLNESSFERQRLEFNRALAERQFRLEVRRHALEKYKTRLDQRFLQKNFGVIVSSAIALAAVLVSSGQVWVAKITRDKELQIAAFQKQADNERTDKQREHEMALQSFERERQWNLDRAKFITENKRMLFEGKPDELRRMSSIIETVFPHDVAATMFENLRDTARSSEAQRVWGNAQQRIQSRRSATPSGTPPISVAALPSPTPVSTCSCPPEIGGGASCWGFDDMAICRVVNGKCVTRCTMPH
jgi:type II secretory pathway pseudopilin PulG